MPWQECSVESERVRLIQAVERGELTMTELCRQAGVSRKTGYKWRARAAAGEDLTDRSHRPHHAPAQTASAMEALVVAARDRHPTWGGRKLHHWLLARGVAEVPAPSTITEILRRHGRLAPQPPPAQPVVRFEHPAPNLLWQMDFMGHWALAGGGRVFPWDLLDDHSRYALALVACPNQQWLTVQAWLTAVFRDYGLPDAILCDNGSPWGTAGAGGISRLAAWLLRLGVEPWHGRPYHPQTQGKIERFHRTLAQELPPRATLATLVETQTAFDAFRQEYNHERPHEALGYATPASRYRPSARPFPEVLPPVVYDAGSIVRTVTTHGSISWQGKRRYVSQGLVGEPVALVPTDDPAIWQVQFGTWQVTTIELRIPEVV